MIKGGSKETANKEGNGTPNLDKPASPEDELVNLKFIF
jgi:hypothetical protein